MTIRTLKGGRFAIVGAMAALLPLLPGCGEPVTAPTTFVPYNSTDGRFACDYPKGWQADGGGNTDYSWAKFTKGGAEIRIDADLVGSLFGDIAQSANTMMHDDSPENAPVAQVHERGKRPMQEQYGKYEERAPKVVKSGFGDGRRSTFIAAESLGGKVYGYRATFLAHDRRITVVCRCPAPNWHVLKPGFEKVLASVRRGGG